MTIDELALELGLTDNAIRGHIAGLERDGLVQQGPLRKGASKPAATYVLTSVAERLFPKAYGLVLSELLRVLNESTSNAEVARILQTVGEQLPHGRVPKAATPSERAAFAVGLLNSLGGSATTEELPGKIVIRGADCPIRAAVEAIPSACVI